MLPFPLNGFATLEVALPPRLNPPADQIDRLATPLQGRKRAVWPYSSLGLNSSRYERLRRGIEPPVPLLSRVPKGAPMTKMNWDRVNRENRGRRQTGGSSSDTRRAPASRASRCQQSGHRWGAWRYDRRTCGRCGANSFRPKCSGPDHLWRDRYNRICERCGPLGRWAASGERTGTK